MGKRFITVSREFGSGGGEIAERLAAALQIPCYDRELIEQQAATERLSKPDRIGTHPADWLSEDGSAMSSVLYGAETDFIRHLAEESDSAVFLGRCSNEILTEYHPIRIFLYASREVEVERVMRKYEITDARRAAALVKRTNANRSGYFEFFTMRKWQNPKNYDLMMDTTRLGVERAAEILLQYVKAIWA